MKTKTKPSAVLSNLLKNLKPFTADESRRCFGSSDPEFDKFAAHSASLEVPTVDSTDYAGQEYGLTPKEMAAAEKRMEAEIKSARRRGELTPFTGHRDDLR